VLKPITPVRFLVRSYFNPDLKCVYVSCLPQNFLHIRKQYEIRLKFTYSSYFCSHTGVRPNRARQDCDRDALPAIRLSLKKSTAVTHGDSKKNCATLKKRQLDEKIKKYICVRRRRLLHHYWHRDKVAGLQMIQYHLIGIRTLIGTNQTYKWV